MGLEPVKETLFKKMMEDIWGQHARPEEAMRAIFHEVILPLSEKEVSLWKELMASRRELLFLQNENIQLKALLHDRYPECSKFQTR
ncbi:hypothetical protein [Desmospora profundinema]|uniref:SRSO17 transposase n=1 Tax=Desmospora profundinema TaxID=1571184 RepID=A0ABU1IRD0_9BACL|nr:hypothetical protein [Desmospora profundinema]MDR6227356.1 SRSO17 transposase [Desmospora profundinema]